jgi:beta-glucosidase
MEMDVPPGRTYRYYTGPVVYPFGYGLSLTTFAVVPVAGPASVALATGDATTVVTYAFNVTNTGSATGDEVLQAYYAPTRVSLPGQNITLLRQLVAFERVHLAGGASTQVSFGVTAAQLSLVTKPAGDTVSAPGTYTLTVTNGTATFFSGTITLSGPVVTLIPFPAPPA